MAVEIPVAEATPAAKFSNSGSLIMMVVIVLLFNAFGAGATRSFVRHAMAAVVARGPASVNVSDSLRRSEGRITFLPKGQRVPEDLRNPSASEMAKWVLSID